MLCVTGLLDGKTIYKSPYYIWKNVQDMMKRIDARIRVRDEFEWQKAR